MLKPKNFEIFRDFLEANHMGDQARDFLMASGKLQALCYKEEIESALRTPGFGGFQLLDLHDFPGQGTALVGVLDPFWDSKPYVTPEEFRRFCGRWSRWPADRSGFDDRRDFLGRCRSRPFRPRDRGERHRDWRLAECGRAAGRCRRRRWATCRRATDVRSAAFDARLADRRRRAKLLASVVGIDGTPFENDWDVWVYPRVVRHGARTTC